MFAPGNTGTQTRRFFVVGVTTTDYSHAGTGAQTRRDLESTTAVAAPAQPAAPAAPSSSAETLSATHHAATTGDMRAFRDATTAERAGKPLPPVPVDTKAPPQERPVSKRQLAINDSIRKAVETATAEKDAEIARLKSAAPAPVAVPEPNAASPQAAAPPTAPVAPPKPKDWKYYVGLADAPKLEDFDSVQEHTAAMSLFVNQTIARETADAAETERLNGTLRERAKVYGESLQKAKVDDPDFVKKIPPAVIHATPLSGCVYDPAQKMTIDPRSGKPVTFANVAAEVAFRSDNPAALLTYLHAHPEETTRIVSLPQGQWLSELSRVDGRLAAPAAPSTPALPAPKVISDVSAPLKTNGSRATAATDPVMAAAKSGDMKAFRAAHRARDMASRT